MAFQGTVFFNQGFGVVGELFDDSPVRAEPFILNSEDPSNNVFGRAFSITSAGFVQAGNPLGTAVFAGFLINPKAAASYGTAVGGALAPTLTLSNNVNVEILNMGAIIVSLPGIDPLPAGGNVGDLIIYDITDGQLAAIAPGVALPVGFLFAQAVVDRFDVDSGLAVIRVTDVPVPPVP